MKQNLSNDMTTAERKPSAEQLRGIWQAKSAFAESLYADVKTASRRLARHDKAGYERGQAGAHHAKFAQLHNEVANALRVWEAKDKEASAAWEAYRQA